MIKRNNFEGYIIDGQHICCEEITNPPPSLKYMVWRGELCCRSCGTTLLAFEKTDTTSLPGTHHSYTTTSTMEVKA